MVRLPLDLADSSLRYKPKRAVAGIYRAKKGSAKMPIPLKISTMEPMTAMTDITVKI